ncbi:COG7 [Symbiodinium sp. KB8]|nr:COG7 [Symbiodinium sp. KB8]
MVYDREAKLLEDVEPGDFVYSVYEKVVDWPTSSDDKWERATHLVMKHRLKSLEWWAEVLQLDVQAP